MTAPVAVLGATGAVGGRFVEVVAAETRAPLRLLVHRWWHTARVVRFPVQLRDVTATAAMSATDLVADAVEGCSSLVSFVDGPAADPALATALVDACARAGIRRLVHLGCVGSFGAAPEGRLDERVDPARPPGPAAARRWAFEQALLESGSGRDVEVVVVAVPLVYGPFTDAGAHRPHDQVERGRVAVARGSGPCHLIYVDDVVEAMWAAVHAPGSVRGRVFATGPAPITWPEFFAAFEAVVGRPGVAVLADDDLAALVHADPAVRADLRWPPPPGTARRLAGALARRTIGTRAASPPRRRLVLPDPDTLVERSRHVEIPLDRAAAVLGWAPAVDLDEGMRRTSAYLRWADPRSP